MKKISLVLSVCTFVFCILNVIFTFGTPAMWGWIVSCLLSIDLIILKGSYPDKAKGCKINE